MASDPLTSWQIDGETVERVADFIFLGSKITPDAACSYEIKRRLLLGRKVMTNLGSTFASPGDLPDSGIEPLSLALLLSHLGSPPTSENIHM